MLSFKGFTGKVKTVALPEPVHTDLVEIPVIIVGSEVVLMTPDLKKLKSETLSAMATAMDGRVGYLKVRAHYEILMQTQHCTSMGCWRPAEPGKHRCDSHSLKD
jgi:hypothetical protein